jgi:hypothetical protein
MKNLLINCDNNSFVKEYDHVIDSLIKDTKGKVSFYIYDDSQKDSLVLREQKSVHMILNNIFDEKFIKYELDSRKKKTKENSFVIIICNKNKYDSKACLFLSKNEKKLNENNMYYCIFDNKR